MASIFKEAASVLQGVWSSNRAGITAGGPAGFALGVVTQVQINYSQQISRMYDLNKDNAVGGGGNAKSAMYYIGGRAEGRATFGRLIGPGKSGCNFYSKFGDICKIKNNNLTLTFEGSGGAGPTCKGKKVTYTLNSPVLISVGITQNAQDTMINENAEFMFADMECA
jgi:hypothetical protein